MLRQRGDSVLNAEVESGASRLTPQLSCLLLAVTVDRLVPNGRLAYQSVQVRSLR